MPLHPNTTNFGAPLLMMVLLGGVSCSCSADLAQPNREVEIDNFHLIVASLAPESQVWGTEANQAMIAHPFVFKADKKLKSVSLVGSFNKWDKTANPMIADADGLTWRLSLSLPIGRYVYKFAPFGPEEQPWVVDPNALLDPTDKVNRNSLLNIVDQPFIFKADRKLKSVRLVGNFNNWDKTANPMVADADGFTWQLHLPLSPGRYVYKFAPFGPEEQTWITDPNAPRDETDKVNYNSLVLVQAPDDIPVVNTATGAPDGKATATVAGHEFIFKAAKKLKSVSLVGSFNKWDKTASPMVADADGLTWHLSLPLPIGRYVYKFAQFGLDGDEMWVVDPGAPLDPTDKVNDNSLLIITPTGYERLGRPTDGITTVSALLHPHSERDVSYDGGQITLSLRTRLNDLSQIWLRSFGQRYPMKLVRTAGFSAIYSAKVPWNRQQDLTYSFELLDGKRLQQFGANGLSSKAQPFQINAKTFRPYLLSGPGEPLKMDGPLTTRTVAGPSWAKNQSIYEVNLDVYHFPKGTALRAYEKHLPVLKEMRVGIIWFMPLYPRGQKKAYGSPYSVRDYTAINPDLGTKEDFLHLVARAHELGLHVLMDWVPNHTAWDNPMIAAHPEFYAKDAQGEIAQAFDWADTAQLDYGQAGQWNKPLWNQMRNYMALWVRDFKIDGFRCDVAGSNGKVPVEFWNWLRPQLDAIKPVFMLAEADDAFLHPAFDMTYSWNLPPVMWDVCAGRKPASAIDDQLRNEAEAYPSGAVRMRFLDNHDWHPHADWDWGKRPPIDTKNGLPQVAPLMVLCATLPGKPLLYNGQETSFLKVDPPSQAEARTKSPVWPFYHSLLELYQSQPAIVEGSFSKIATNQDDKIYAFMRQRGMNRVLVVVNLSDETQSATLKTPSLIGQYHDWFGKGQVQLGNTLNLKLPAWAYRVFVADEK